MVHFLDVAVAVHHQTVAAKMVLHIKMHYYSIVVIHTCVAAVEEKSTGIFWQSICFLISAVSSLSTATAKGQTVVFLKSRKSSPKRFWLPDKLHEFNMSTNKVIINFILILIKFKTYSQRKYVFSISD